MYPYPTPKPKKDPNALGAAALGSPVAPAVASPLPQIARPKPTPLQQQAAGTQASYGASVDRMGTAQRQANGIQIPAPIIREGRGTVSSIASPGTNAAVTALGTLGGVARDEQAKQSAMIPTFQQQAAGLRQQAGNDRANAARQGANTLLQGVGAAPVARPMPSPATRPSPGIASPTVAFAGVDPAPAGMFRKPSPPASNPVQPSAISAPSLALHPGDVNTFTGSNGRTVAVPGMSSPATGSVESQSFGTQPTIARPGGNVASTYSLPVTQMTSAPIQRPGQMTFASAPQTSEYNNSKEDRAGRTKMISDLDSQRFRLEMIAGNPGRRGRAALDALGTNAKQQADLAGAGEVNSAAAVQGRANRGNQFDIADMGNQGENFRTQIGADVSRDGQQVEREGQQLGYRSSMARIDSEIARPDIIPSRDGTLMRVGRSGPAAAVVDANGNPVQGAAVANPNQLTPGDILKSYDAQTKSITDQMFNADPDSRPALQQQLQAISAQREALLSGGQGTATKVTTIAQYEALPKGSLYLAPDGKTYTKN